MIRLFSALCILSFALSAQTGSRASVRAFGEATVSVRPDQATVTISVVTRGTTARAAATENATVATQVIAKLEQIIGQAGEVRTVSYTLTPNYTYPRDGGPPTLTGFTATNSVQAIVTNLNLIGGLVDAAIEAGASRVDNLSLSVKDDEAARAQALREAGQRARRKAEAIALGLGVRLGQVIAADEGVSYRPASIDRSAAPGATAVTTPIETGTLQVHATITLEIAINP